MTNVLSEQKQTKFLNKRDFVENEKQIRQHVLKMQSMALRYKPEGRGFDSRWCQCNSSLT
jgi:hypothetical protein